MWRKPLGSATPPISMAPQWPTQKGFLLRKLHAQWRTHGLFSLYDGTRNPHNRRQHPGKCCCNHKVREQIRQFIHPRLHHLAHAGPLLTLTAHTDDEATKWHKARSNQGTGCQTQSTSHERCTSLTLAPPILWSAARPQTKAVLESNTHR